MSTTQIVWQGASLDGQHLFQLTKSAANVWQLYEIGFTGTNAVSRKMVTTPALFMDAFAAIGAQYALMFLPGAITRLANRSIARNAANAIPATGAVGAQTGIVRRARRRVSVTRSSTIAAT